MIYLTEKSADCNAGFVIDRKSASVVAKTSHRIGFVPGQRKLQKTVS